MTREEFAGQFGRLCDAHRFVPTTKQTEAFYELLQQGNVEDFRMAVTRLSAATRFPASVEMIQREMDRAEQGRRTAQAAAERAQAGETMAGRAPSAGRSPIERRYWEKRMGLLIRAMTEDQVGSVVRIHAEGLADVIADPVLSRWMVEAAMGACRFHAADHTVYECVVDEWNWWTLRAAGKDPVEAFRELRPIARVPLRDELLLRVDEYGRVRANQMTLIGERETEETAETIGEACSQ